MSTYDAPALRPNIVEDLAPGSAEWTKCVTASKISGILGLSSWASPYSLWADAVGVTEPQTPDAGALKRYDRGHRLEAVLLQYLADWFQEQGLKMRVRPGATVRHPDGLDRYANPDGWVYEGRRRTRDPLRDPVHERSEHGREQDRDRDGREDHRQPTDRLPEQPATTGDEEQTRGPRRRQQDRVREVLAGDRRRCHVMRIGAGEGFLPDIERLRTGQVWAESRPRTDHTPRRSIDAR